MNKQKALRLARKWAQGHVCSLRDGEAEEYHAMFAEMLEESMSNEQLTLEQLREMDEIPIYVVTEKYGSGWCVLNWHGVKKSYTYFSRTGTSEGMTATPLSAKTYGDLWIAYRCPPEGEEDTK